MRKERKRNGVKMLLLKRKLALAIFSRSPFPWQFAQKIIKKKHYKVYIFHSIRWIRCGHIRAPCFYPYGICFTHSWQFYILTSAFPYRRRYAHRTAWVPDCRYISLYVMCFARPFRLGSVSKWQSLFILVLCWSCHALPNLLIIPPRGSDWNIEWKLKVSNQSHTFHHKFCMRLPQDNTMESVFSLISLLLVQFKVSIIT